MACTNLVSKVSNLQAASAGMPFARLRASLLALSSSAPTVTVAPDNLGFRCLTRATGF